MMFQRNSTRKPLGIGRGLAIASLLVIAPTYSAIAQIIPDNTLPVNSSVPLGCTNCTIDGGTVRGANLYHSFSQFSVPTNGTAFFNNGAAIQAIFARVIGSNPSTIDGLIRTNGTASLFLFNPNGILFGANARLDIAGTFVATTASSLKFADGSEFSATNPQAPPLLTINITPGLQYGSSQPGATITNRGNLSAGENLILVANQLDLQGQLQAGSDLALQAENKVLIRDSATTPFLAQAGGNLTIQGNQSIDILALNHPGYPFSSGGNLTLISDGGISTDAHFVAGGDFAILTLAGNPANFVSLYDPLMLVGGSYSVGDYTGDSLQVEAGGNITYGTVVIDGIDSTNVYPTNPAFFLRAGGTIQGNGNVSTTVPGGNLIVDFQSQGNINTRRITTQGGSITLNSQNGSIVTPTNGAGFFGELDSTSSQYGGGNITLIANGSIIVGRVYSYSTASVAGNSSGAITIISRNGNIQADHVFSYSTSPLGNGGDITLIARNGSIKAWGFSSAADSSNNGISPAGNGGLVNLFAKGNIDIVPPVPTLSGIFSFTNSRNRIAGNGGKIGVTTTQGNITISGDIFSGSPSANGGDVTIATSQGNVDLGIYGTYTRSLGLGKGGDITVSAQGGTLKMGETNAFSVEGAGGAIALNATGDLITYSLNTTGKLGSGNITITSGGIFLTAIRSNGESSNSSVISSDTFGAGRGGEIAITARSILLQKGAQISASTHGSGDGGNIVLRALDGIVLSGVVPNGVKAGPYARAGLAGVRTGQYLGGYIPTGVTSNINDANFNTGQFPSGVFTQVTVGSTGNAGNITISAGQLTVSDRAAIAATTFGQGNAGNIQVTVPTSSISLENGAIFSGVASSALGSSGKIDLQARALFLTNGLIQSRTLGMGNAGAIQITTTDSVSLMGAISAIRSGSGDEVFRSSQIGRAGDIRLATGNLILGDRATLTAETFTAAKGGNILINANSALIQDGARVTVSGQGSGAAGDIQIQASNLLLTRQAQILTSTASSQGGNIQIQVQQPLWMRQNSLISATSGTAGGDGDGGNIWIKAPFLLALPQENNDIIANAYTSRGGRIEITAYGIFGFEFRSRNDLMRLLGTQDPAQLDPQRLSSNDITAISQGNPILNGEVVLNTDPPPRTLPLAVNLLDGVHLVSPRCSSQSQSGNTFVMTGKGGLPPSPTSVLSGDTTLVELATLNQAGEENQVAEENQTGEAPIAKIKLQKMGLGESATQMAAPLEPQAEQGTAAIVEAQSWVINSNGVVSLVATAPATGSGTFWASSPVCLSSQ